MSEILPNGTKVLINIEDGLATGKGVIVDYEDMTSVGADYALRHSYLVRVEEHKDLDKHGLVNDKIWVNGFEVEKC